MDEKKCKKINQKQKIQPMRMHKWYHIASRTNSKIFRLIYNLIKQF